MGPEEYWNQRRMKRALEKIKTMRFLNQWDKIENNARLRCYLRTSYSNLLLQKSLQLKAHSKCGSNLK